MARIVAAHMPKALPKTFETEETHVKIVRHYVMETDKKGETVFSHDENGRKIKAGPNTLEFEQVKSFGGIMFTFPRGHSIRLSSPEQLKQFKLTEQPKLVDLDLGEEVNAAGVPVSVLAIVADSNRSGGDFGMVDTLEKD
jgi:hypothetical protein